MSQLFVAARSSNTEHAQWKPVGVLSHENDTYFFAYTQGAQSLDGFKPFHGMDDLETVYASAELFPVFKNRLLTERRAEYENYLKWSGFALGATPDPIAVLGVTEGIRLTDAIELFPKPAPNSEGLFTNKFFLHGLRNMPEAARLRVAQLKAGDRLVLAPEQDNAYDQYAVSLLDGEQNVKLGYVPRYLARDLHRLAEECTPQNMQVCVAQVNLDAPLQQRLLCHLQACWPQQFQPCSDDDFLPITELAVA
jgi:hypothetical protein